SQVRQRARTVVAHLQTLALRPGVGDEFLQRLGREVLAHNDEMRRYQVNAEIVEIGARIVGQLRVGGNRGGMRAHVSEADRVPVRLRSEGGRVGKEGR